MKKRTRALSLPKKICVLDIESAELVDFEKPSSIKIAIVGTREWHKKGSKYIPGKYLAFSPEDIAGTVPFSGLRTYLEEFEGPIIGHNIFDFDLRVLSCLFEVKKIASKIIDTMAVLFPRNNGHHFGLALDNLAKKNLNKSKIDSGKKVPHLWKTRKFNQVIKYNQRDLELTKGIWEYMIKNQSIHIRYDYHPDGGDTVHPALNSNDLQILIGKRKQFSFDNLSNAYKSGEKLLPYKPYVSPYRKHVEMQELLAEAQELLEPNIVYYWIFCEDCSVTNFYRANIQCGFADHEIAKCGVCEKNLSEVRADLGLEYITSVPIAFEDGTCQGFVPGPIKKIIRKELKHQMRYLEAIINTKGCSICKGSRDPDRSSEPFTNPLNGMPVCSRCWTAGYWQFELK